MKRKIKSLSLKNIVLDRSQFRRHFDKNELKELRESIKKHGLLNPILVRPLKDGKFELIHGEKRFKITNLIRRKTILAEIRNVSDKEKLEIQLLESLRRGNIAPTQEIKTYKQLIEEFGYTREQIAERINTSKEDVTDKLGLTKFLPQLQEGEMKEKTTVMKTNDQMKSVVLDTTENGTESERAVWMDPNELTLSSNNVRKNIHDKEIRMIAFENYKKDDILGDKEFWLELLETKLATLVESVSRKGVMVPIIINQHNQVVAGQRRWLATKRAGKKIPCIRRYYESPIEEICDSLIENEGRRPLDLYDKYFALKNLRDKYGLSIRQISEYAGIPKSTVHDLLKRGDMEQNLSIIPEEYHDVLRKMRKTKQRIAGNMIAAVGEPTPKKITRIIDYCLINPDEVINWEKKYYGENKLVEKILSRPYSDTCPLKISLSIPIDIVRKLLPLVKKKKMSIEAFILNYLAKTIEEER